MRLVLREGEEIEGGLLLLKSTNNFSDAIKLYSILCDMRFCNEFKNKCSFEYFIYYKMLFHEAGGFKPSLINNSTSMKTMKFNFDSMERIQEFCPEIENRTEIFKKIDESLLKYMQLNDSIDIVHEKNCWSNYHYDEFTVIHKNPKIISIFDLNRGVDVNIKKIIFQTK